ncbi:MAG: CDP-alcohol phosphatidyltransferase family protein [Candidatus Micrarchaeota archaeon]|nr:CDP-alcohol phosphatidyltransferase family protein [Candidatus Micrarchaeota archaeon]
MLKKKFYFLIEWVISFFDRINIEPNFVTLSSVFFAFISSYLIYIKNNLAILFVLLAFFADAVDGALARRKNKVSRFGAYLDGICDRIVEFFIILPFLFFQPTALAAIILMFFGSFMHAFSKAYSDHRKILDSKTAANLSTIFGRVERTILLIFVVIFYIMNIELYLYLLWIGAILSLIAFIVLQIKIGKAA